MLRTTILASALAITSSLAAATDVNISAANAYSSEYQAVENIAQLYGFDLSFYTDTLAKSHADFRYGSNVINRSTYINQDIKNAWASGFTGQDVDIFVQDQFGSPTINWTGWNPRHGMVTTNIIGGEQNWNGTQFVGIAPDARIHRSESSGGEWNSKHEIANYSLGFGQVVTEADIGVTKRDYSHPNLHEALRVVSAGNDRSTCLPGAKCNYVALKWYHSTQKDTLLTVGSLNTAKDGIASYSNKAGILKDHYVVDDAHYHLDWDRGSDYDYGWYTRGTSFAAPTTSGKAALIQSKFPSLTARQLADVIKTTADDLGAPGVDDIFGHGRVNLKRALSPVGILN